MDLASQPSPLLSVDIPVPRGQAQRDISRPETSLQLVAWRVRPRLQYRESLYSQGFGYFYFNTEWASLGTRRGIR